MAGERTNALRLGETGFDRSKLPKAAGYATPTTTTSWPGTPYSGDLQRANQAGVKDAVLAGGISALGTAAQIGLSAIDTAQDRENKKRLAALAKDKGLSTGERAEIDERAMRGVRALAAENQTRDGDALASAGQTSAAALQRSRASNADALNRAAIHAADIGIRADRDQVRADQQEEQERIAYKSERARQRIEMVGQAVAGIAQSVAPVLAANPSARAPTDRELDRMRDSGKYPFLWEMDNAAARAKWTADQKAAQQRGNRPPPRAEIDDETFFANLEANSP